MQIDMFLGCRKVSWKEKGNGSVAKMRALKDGGTLDCLKAKGKNFMGKKDWSENKSITLGLEMDSKWISVAQMEKGKLDGEVDKYFNNT